MDMYYLYSILYLFSCLLTLPYLCIALTALSPEPSPGIYLNNQTIREVTSTLAKNYPANPFHTSPLEQSPDVES